MKTPRKKGIAKKQPPAGQAAPGRLLPGPEDPVPVNELIRQGLLLRLAELRVLLGADALERTDLARADLRAIAERLDRALSTLTGVSPRDRALVRLELAARDFGASVKGDLYAPGPEANLKFPLRAFGEFCRAVSQEFPHVPEKMIKSKILGPCVVSYARSLHPGRPRRGGRIPEKWTAFRDLAASLGIISERTGVESLKRMVLEARRKRSRVGSPIQEGVR